MADTLKDAERDASAPTWPRQNEGVTLMPDNTRIVLAEQGNGPVTFLINNPQDRIHRVQSRGVFYERQQLARMAQVFPKGGTFVDVGANIGNHSLYMLTQADAGLVIPFEPNPESIAMYEAVMRVNKVQGRVDLGTLGFGLGASDDDSFGIHNPKENLGWASLRPGEGDIPVRRGDTLIGDRDVDFIKMDVEGMEIDALRGLTGTLKRCKPALFIEVAVPNLKTFEEMVTDLGYELAHAFDRSGGSQNMLWTAKAPSR